MATEVFVTIRPSGDGGDYTSMSAAEAGEQQNFVTADEYLVAEVQGDWSSAADGPVLFTGSTLDATRYMEFRADASNRFNGEYSTSRYRIDGASPCLHVRQGHTYLIGLQVTQSSGSDGVIVVRDSDGIGHVHDCYVSNTNQGILVRFSGTAYVKNTTAVGGAFAFRFRDDTLVFCHSCTARDSGVGFDSVNAGTNYTLRNCLADGNSTADFQGSWGAANNNASSDSSAPGTGSITDATIVFVSSTDMHIDASDASGIKTGGANLSADSDLPVTTDFEGDSRSATPTIGADEFVAAAAGGALPIPAFARRSRLSRNSNLRR